MAVNAVALVRASTECSSQSVTWIQVYVAETERDFSELSVLYLGRNLSFGVPSNLLISRRCSQASQSLQTF